MNDKTQQTYIQLEQLCVGLYVYIDLGWLEHSFPFNSFKIKSNEQIESIKRLGLKKIRINPSRSDCAPLPLATEEQPETEEVVESVPTPEDIEAMNAKKARVDQQIELRNTAMQCKERFLKATDALKSITRNIFNKPEEAYREADVLIGQMLDSMLTDKEVAVHLMSDQGVGEEVYLHSMNVAVLAMMLAKELSMGADDIRNLGIGCLFHDVGKPEAPERIMNKTGQLTRAEQSILGQHCQYGGVIAQKLGLSPEALDIVSQHHEYIDGSGYPKQLQGEEISRLARIASIVNMYDNHCNPPNPADALSPYEALSTMFAQQRKLFDSELLNVFIRCMGVYPPGTIVGLSNDMLGIVVSVNSGKPLRPSVLVYDPDVPKGQAIILDLLKDAEVNVSHSLKPKQLPRDIYEYLDPRKRITYYFDMPKATAATEG